MVSVKPRWKVSLMVLWYPLFCTVAKLSTFAHINPVSRLCGMRGRTPKYKFGRYGPQSSDEFEVSATWKSSSAMADQGERDKINTETKEIASAGARNRGWSIVRLRSSYKLVNLFTNWTPFARGGLRKQV
jgi:hypothetical protein